MTDARVPLGRCVAGMAATVMTVHLDPSDHILHFHFVMMKADRSTCHISKYWVFEAWILKSPFLDLVDGTANGGLSFSVVYVTNTGFSPPTSAFFPFFLQK